MCIDCVLGQLVIDAVDMLEGKGGLRNGSVNCKDAVLVIHADWLVSGGARIDWGVRAACKEVGVKKAVGWE